MTDGVDLLDGGTPEEQVLKGLFGGDFRVTDDAGRDITEACIRKVIDGTYLRELSAQAAQEAVAAHRGTQRFNRKLDMMPLMHIDPVVYWHWVAREGHECWGDAGFRRDMIRDNPSLKARVEMPGDRVGWTPAMEAAGAQTGGLVRAGKYSKIDGGAH